MAEYTVFLIEDDVTIAEAVAGYLLRYGFCPVRVSDFSRVEQEFLQVRPHLVLMDVTLPYQDGFHLTRAIRRHSAVPILFISSRVSQLAQVLGMESGGDDYITKPFDLEVLTLHYWQVDDWRKTGPVLAQLEDAAVKADPSLAAAMTDLYNGPPLAGMYSFYQQNLGVGRFMFFITGFMVLMFFLAAGNMIYFKLFTDLEQDRQQFAALAKLGLGRGDVQGIVSRQLLVLFFVPLLVGAGYAVTIITMLPTGTGVSVLLPLLSTVGTYALLQFLYFLVARRIYTGALLEPGA